MKVRITHRCPHCDKAIRIREISMDKASKAEAETFIKSIFKFGRSSE